MKTTGVSQASKKNPDSCRAFWTMSLLCLLVMPLFLLATEAGAAKITFEPNELTATVAPGEVVTVPVTVSLNDTTADNSYASFSLTRVDGTLNPAWMKSRIPVSLNAMSNTRQVQFQVSVPAEAEGGEYTSVFRTEGLRSSELVAPADLMITVDVSQTLFCNQVPLFSDISSAEETISVRNHKEVTVELSGAVSVPDGCDISDTWYKLIDEYGELDQDEVPLVINDDGTFSVAVPMVASRKGKDKDGRLYTVTFFAENEAGVGESPETTIVVLHDNHEKDKHKKGKHKKEKYGSKKESHDSKKRES